MGVLASETLAGLTRMTPRFLIPGEVKKVPGSLCVYRRLRALVIYEMGHHLPQGDLRTTVCYQHVSAG
jgi:hypothetical protein